MLRGPRRKAKKEPVNCPIHQPEQKATGISNLGTRRIGMVRPGVLRDHRAVTRGQQRLRALCVSVRIAIARVDFTTDVPSVLRDTAGLAQTARCVPRAVRPWLCRARRACSIPT
ncbi:hypothetical protein [Mycetohabitans endofungorum]|uniref:hypothetical protein n=1 Tax=Mycetohabitans endofungorum TaxID=417203 RepID=UPI002B05ED9C|nr:hypothetical protein [Mycetohabitans endofungorum]